MQNLIFLGDSITQALGTPENARWTAVVGRRLEAVAPERYEVWNRGIGGDTTALVLDRLARDVLPLLPATVVIELGINDAYVFPWRRTSRVSLAEFTHNYGELVSLITDAGGKIILIVNHEITEPSHEQGNQRPTRDNLAPYQEAIRALGGEHRFPLIDLPQMQAAQGIPAEALLSEDGIHLTAAGNRRYGELVADALIPFLA